MTFGREHNRGLFDGADGNYRQMNHRHNHNDNESAYDRNECCYRHSSLANNEQNMLNIENAI